MTLRMRLLLALVALVAAGLLVTGFVTYTDQRSFLYRRVDQQLQGAYPLVERQLDELTHAANADPGSDDRGPHLGDLAPPPGTYAQRRDTSGTRVIKNLRYSHLPVPRLPAHVPISDDSANARLFTVHAANGSGLSYRAMAARSQDGVTVVALSLHDATATLDHLLLVEAIVAAAVLASLAFVAWWIVRLGLRPLDRMAETAAAIAAGELSHRVTPAEPRTEVGRLGLSLNAMLEQIEQAFASRQQSEDRLRHFLADASHELRTPLASIRGYAELFRIGAARNPEDVEKAMRRIEQESARMGSLVDDLLTLARSDQLPEPVKEPVDLVRLARDARDDTNALDPDRAVSLDADGPVTVLGDARALRQVISNLTGNALAHTPPGTPIDLRVAQEGDDAILEVRDHGPGLPTSDAETLFERFWRAEHGRGRGAAGAGLGRAMVAAIVAAHHGRAEARNAPGGGASFTVRLPAARPAAARPRSATEQPEEAR
jgi:two-component system OmpR family sensor kinase